jgi:choline dehydrogenase-like flavoprotein
VSRSSEYHRCEVLVVGSGPGGSVTAWTLSSHGKDVLLVEEGAHRKLDSCRPFGIDEMLHKYRAAGLNPALGTPTIPFVEGCCVGGGSEINSGLYHRTPSDVLDRWSERYRVRSLSEADLRPHFEACESALGVRLNPGKPLPAAAKMRVGADALGWKNREIPRFVRYEDSLSPDTSARGTRQSMTETLIPCALGFGCRLLPGVRAQSAMHENGRWKLSATRAGNEVTIEADSVFVCGGAVQTPALLRRSGICKNIGNSLAVHPTIKVVAVFNEEVNALCGDVPSRQVTEFSPEICMGCSISSLPHIALAMADHPDANLDFRRIWRRMAIYYAMIPGPTSGVVRNVPFSANPLVRYRLGGSELRSLADALRYLCRLLLAAGATHLFPSIYGFPALQSEDDLSRIPAELPRHSTNLMTIHLFSSCPMGEALERCAVDSFGLVHGQPNLFVNDASVLCTAPGVNPQGSIMAIARRNALHFLNAL